MRLARLTLALCMVLWSGACAHAQPAETMPSAVYAWEELAVVTHEAGERRAVLSGRSRTLENLSIHITTLNPGLASHAPHRHVNEEAVFLREGTLEVYLNGETKVVGPGAVLVFMSNDWHAVRNVGDAPAIYEVINWTSEATLRLPAAPAE